MKRVAANLLYALAHALEIFLKPKFSSLRACCMSASLGIAMNPPLEELARHICAHTLRRELLLAPKFVSSWKKTNQIHVATNN
jgi:hypothetical protein